MRDDRERERAEADRVARTWHGAMVGVAVAAYVAFLVFAASDCLAKREVPAWHRR